VVSRACCTASLMALRCAPLQPGSACGASPSALVATHGLNSPLPAEPTELLLPCVWDTPQAEAHSITWQANETANIGQQSIEIPCSTGWGGGRRRRSAPSSSRSSRLGLTALAIQVGDGPWMAESTLSGFRDLQPGTGQLPGKSAPHTPPWRIALWAVAR